MTSLWKKSTFDLSLLNNTQDNVRSQSRTSPRIPPRNMHIGTLQLQLEEI